MQTDTGKIWVGLCTRIAPQGPRPHPHKPEERGKETNSILLQQNRFTSTETARVSGSMGDTTDYKTHGRHISETTRYHSLLPQTRSQHKFTEDVAKPTVAMDLTCGHCFPIKFCTANVQGQHGNEARWEQYMTLFSPEARLHHQQELRPNPQACMVHPSMTHRSLAPKTKQDAKSQPDQLRTSITGQMRFSLNIPNCVSPAQSFLPAGAFLPAGVRSRESKPGRRFVR